MTWRRPAVSVMMMLIVLSFLPPLASAQDQPALGPALQWLREQQAQDGGFSSGLSPGSDPGATADAMVAAVSAGEDPRQWQKGGNTPLDFLKDQVQALAVTPEAPGLVAKVVLALSAVDVNPRQFADSDLLAWLEDGFDAERGAYGSGPFDTSLVLLGIHAAGEAIPQGATEALIESRLQDGSYAFEEQGLSGDSNTTAMAVQALIAADRPEEVAPSLAYFQRVQNDDGGWTFQKPSDFGESTDANSTALVIQALLASGESLQAWGRPDQALLGLQLDSGAFAFSAEFPEENALATIQAIPALAGMPLTAIGEEVKLGEQPRVATPSGSLILLIIGLLAILLLGAAILQRRSNGSQA